MNADPQVTDDRSDDQIISTALAPSCEEDSDEYWSAVRILQYRMSTELFDKMRELISGGNDRERHLAADAMAQGRRKDKEFGKECVQLLLGALKSEKSNEVLTAICSALGHHKSEIAIGPLVKLQTHEDANVRLGVVHGLTSIDDPAAIAALILLSADSDRDVRNWATFGLASMTEADSVPIREALVERLAESDDEVSGEAMVGLALRGDTRVSKPLLEAINKLFEHKDQPGELIFEAMEAVRVAALKHPDESWKPVLARCQEVGFCKSSK